MVDIRKFWPVAVYAIAVWANTDILAPVVLTFFGSSLRTISAVSLVATLEILYGYWFWGWVFGQGPEIQSLRARRRAKNRKGLVSVVIHGVTDWVLDGVLQAYRKVTTAEDGIRRRIHQWGVLAVWVLGVNPIPGLPTRGPCCAFLGFYRLRGEFPHLVLANLVHVTISMVGWGWLLGR